MKNEQAEREDGDGAISKKVNDEFSK